MSEYFRKYIKKDHYPAQPANIRFKTSFKNCVLEALRRRNWKETEHETEWEIYWTEKEWIIDVMDHIHLAPNQRVNHFRNYYELCRKDNLIKNLKRHKKNLEKEGRLDEAAAYNFFPTTYSLPSEYSIFCEEFKKNSNTVWIMKPIGKAQGKGIFLFNKLSQVSQWKSDTRWKPESPQVENYVVQRYINNPLLIGGKKFDMRIYCLVTSYSPLVAYLYRNGFARFTHHRYNSDDITNTYVHLTNVAIQKTSENYDEKIGGKWDLRTLKLYMISHFGQEAVSECFSEIQKAIVRALHSVQKVIINDKHSFELYGFDILLDSQLKPWLLEVNGSPSMTANTPHDFDLKCNLLDDVFTIIDMERILTGQEEQIGGFDLICKGTPIKKESSLFSTMLGCHNNRYQQLKKLAKMISSKLTQTFIQEKEKAKKGNTGKEKDAQSTAPSDTSITVYKTKSSKQSSKVIPSAGNAGVLSKNTKGSTLLKQNTVSASKETKDSREPKEVSSISTVNGLKSVKGKLKETGKSKATIGLPPVNTNSTATTAAGSISNISNNAINIYTASTPSGNTSTSQRTSITNNQVSQPSYQPTVAGKFSQVVGMEKSSTNFQKRRQMTGEGSLKSETSPKEKNMHVKRKGSKKLEPAREENYNIYNYNMNERPPSTKIKEKPIKYLSVKNNDDVDTKQIREKNNEADEREEEGASYVDEEEEEEEEEEDFRDKKEEDYDSQEHSGRNE